MTDGEGRAETRFEQRGSLSPAQTSAARYARSRCFDRLAERPGGESRRTGDDGSSGRG